ncbi:cytochrome c oxidase assembly protein [Bacillus salipaludis]|uniref:Cytochrome c oxidase assembly protein n=1 Tax=Bacillus salipaludis TaxID=2547811 RepID=A0ABW8R9R5_9BACI
MFYAVWLEGQLVWNIPLLTGLICIAVLYGCLVTFYTNIKIYHKQPLLFFLCLGILYVTLGSPLSTLSHLSFSFHMMQMSILYFIIPPLFLLGIPESFPKILKGINKLFLPPLVALYTFAVLFLMYHLPIVLTFLSKNSFVHNGYLVLLFIMALSMWCPIVKDRNKPFALLSGLLLMPACILFIITGFIGGLNNPFLAQMTANLCISPSAISSLHILPPPFNTGLDQIMAGILMIVMHKFALILTVRFGKKVHVQEWGRMG